MPGFHRASRTQPALSRPPEPAGLTRGPRRRLLILPVSLGPHAAAEESPVASAEGAGRPQLLPQALEGRPGPGRARLLGSLRRPRAAAVSPRARGRQQQQQEQEPERTPRVARHGRVGSRSLRRPSSTALSSHRWAGRRRHFRGPDWPGIGVATGTAGGQSSPPT